MESIISLSKYLLLLVMLIVFGNCYANFGSHAQLIPEDEVQTLKIISSKLKNNYWNVSRTSCNDGGRSLNKNFTDISFSNVTCNCSFNSSTVCHVTSIQLKGLNLSGTLPTEFGNLPHLQVIDLYQNYINGSIPTSFAMIPLVNLSLIANRISGSIPKELGQIPTLEELLLEDNQLGETLPDSLGNLSCLRRMVLSSNNFTGSIPETFGNLKNLTELRIDGSRLSGKIPAFIGNWSKIVTVHMQGTNMEGPIPSTISLLTNLITLRISDLNGASMAFPNLQNLKQLHVLVLRNCLLIGTIPEYIGDMTNMRILDLSFNRLTGKIPDTIENLQSLEYMFLTNNSLNGLVPSWLVTSKENFDVSYNNFTESVTASCKQSNVNLVSSFPFTKNNANSWCLMKDLPCPTKAEYSSLFINCGGKEMSYDGNEYKEDLSPFGPSFFASYDSTKWAYSSTGVFLTAHNADYIASNKFNLNITGPEYYETARVAPLSLRYYGLCLRKGSYRVQLHFAEIMYSDDLSSIVRRIFDVSIQGNLVLKDFNILEEAGHVGKGITKDFTNIFVNSSTLEISLYWAGKGTTHVPKTAVYGPLISAITITPNFNTHIGYSVGAIVGIVIASCVILASLLLFLQMKGYLGRKSKGDEGLYPITQGRGLEVGEARSFG